MTAVTTVTTKGETSALCASVGVSRAAFYRRQRPACPPRPRAARAPSPRALGPGERLAVLVVPHSERFVDQSPAEVHATLLEEQTYLCAPRTMYRIVAEAGEVRERRDQVRHPAHAKPDRAQGLAPYCRAKPIGGCGDTPSFGALLDVRDPADGLISPF